MLGIIKRASTSCGTYLETVKEKTMKEASAKRHYKEAAEVQAELEYFRSKNIYDFVNDIKRRIENGEVRVTNEPSLKKEQLELSDEITLIHPKQWEYMLNEEKRVEKFIPREERRQQDDHEAARFQGAICALHWLLGHHNEELATYVTSEQFEVVIEL
jgi:hypothetical protein